MPSAGTLLPQRLAQVNRFLLLIGDGDQTSSRRALASELSHSSTTPGVQRSSVGCVSRQAGQGVVSAIYSSSGAKPAAHRSASIWDSSDTSGSSVLVWLIAIALPGSSRAFAKDCATLACACTAKGAHR